MLFFSNFLKGTVHSNLSCKKKILFLKNALECRTRVMQHRCVCVFITSAIYTGATHTSCHCLNTSKLRVLCHCSLSDVKRGTNWSNWSTNSLSQHAEHQQCGRLSRKQHVESVLSHVCWKLELDFSIVQLTCVLLTFHGCFLLGRVCLYFTRYGKVNAPCSICLP